MINTDGSPSLRSLVGHDVDYQVIGGKKEIVNAWLPWVHKLISNSKAWVIGTHTVSMDISWNLTWRNIFTGSTVATIPSDYSTGQSGHAF